MSASQGGQPAAGAVRRAWDPVEAERSTIVVNGTGALQVDIRFDVLRDAAVNGGTIEIPVDERSDPQDDDFVETFERVLTRSSRGPLADRHDGEVSLTMVGDALAGRIVVDGRVFIVRRAANSALHLVTEMDQASFPPEGQPLVPPADRGGRGSADRHA